MHADRIRAVLRPGAEDAAHRRAPVVARMHAQRRAVGAIEPGEDKDLVACPQVARRLLKGRIEDEPGLGRALVSLLRRVLAVDEWRADAPYRCDRDHAKGRPWCVSADRGRRLSCRASPVARRWGPGVRPPTASTPPPPIVESSRAVRSDPPRARRRGTVRRRASPAAPRASPDRSPRAPPPSTPGRGTPRRRSPRARAAAPAR